MAQHKLSGNQVFLFIDSAGGTDYDTMVCLTGKTWKGGNNVIDASSQCGPDNLPGQAQPQSISFTGQQVFNPDAGNITSVSLHTMLQNQTTIGWKISPAAPIEGDEILSGTGFLSELSKEYADASPATFTATLSIYGQTTQTIEGS